MRYDQTCENFADLARRQADLAVKAPFSFFVGAMLAGGFVGIAAVLSLSLGAHLDPTVRPLVMGSVFGISVILTIFGGGELFTGQVMFATLGILRGRLTRRRAVLLLSLAWLGNLWGAALVASLFAVGGGGHVYDSTALLRTLVDFKIHSPATSLLARAILCNWLACLGIWTAGRLKSEGAKLVVLAWCVMAYVACGFEHSIANMAVFALGLMAPTPVGDIAGAASSVAIVSLGNMIGGGALVAGAYALYSRGEHAGRVSGSPAEAESPELPHMPRNVRDSLAGISLDGLKRAA